MAYEGQHMICVEVLSVTTVVAVVHRYGHVRGCMLVIVDPSRSACSHHEVTAGATHLFAMPP